MALKIGSNSASYSFLRDACQSTLEFQKLTSKSALLLSVVAVVTTSRDPLTLRMSRSKYLGTCHTSKTSSSVYARPNALF